MALDTRNIPELLDRAVERAKRKGPVRVAVANAAQRVLLETLRDAEALGIAVPRLVGDPGAITKLSDEIGWSAARNFVVPAQGERAAAARSVTLAREGDADVVMKGNVHTDAFMRALLDKDQGLRLPGRRVSHVFLADEPDHPKLLGITDAAINIAPDLAAKAQICQNAIDLFRLLGVETPKVAALSAIETVNPDVVSTIDAACLTVMARRGQIRGAQVDGPLAFDNAISPRAAKEKGIASAVAGDADILLVPDLVSGNILAKNLQYLAEATMAGVALGLAAPVVLTSRADPAAARLASLALATLMRGHDQAVQPGPGPVEPDVFCAPQQEAECCPLPEAGDAHRHAQIVGLAKASP